MRHVSRMFALLLVIVVQAVALCHAGLSQSCSAAANELAAMATLATCDCSSDPHDDGPPCACSAERSEPAEACNDHALPEAKNFVSPPIAIAVDVALILEPEVIASSPIDSYALAPPKVPADRHSLPLLI